MGIAHQGSHLIIRTARIYHGKCGICHEAIIKGQKYVICIGGTNTKSGYDAHLTCYLPVVKEALAKAEG